jgi:GNAT superfamily N-acetyltransferase
LIKDISEKDFPVVKDFLSQRWRVDEWLDPLTFKGNFLRLGEGYCLKYLIAGKIVGVVLATKNGDSVDLRSILVCEGHRRKKIGSRLIKRLEENALKQKLKTIFLYTGRNDSDKGSAIFYLTLGFHITGYAVVGGGRERIFFEKMLVPQLLK